MLGCGCQEIPHELNKYLDFEASDTKTSQPFHPWVKLTTQPRSVQAGYSCTHGFYHPEYRVRTGSWEHYRPGCPDFLGLAAFSGGCQIVIDALKDTPRPVSYYGGYLVICAARGLRPQSAGQRSKVNAHLKLINWLIMNDANLLTPHVINVRSTGDILGARSPIMECWLSISRLAQGLRTSPPTPPDTQELDALLTALTRTDSTSGVPIILVVGGSPSDPRVDFEVSTGFYGYIIVEAEVNEFSSYCVARLASLQESAGTTSDQQDFDSAPKLSQLAKINFLSLGESHGFHRVNDRAFSVAETISPLDAVEEAPTHNTAEPLNTLMDNVWARLRNKEPVMAYLASVLADHGRRLGMTDYYGQRYSYIVPPDLYHELNEQTWYEQGTLREGMIW